MFHKNLKDYFADNERPIDHEKHDKPIPMRKVDGVADELTIGPTTTAAKNT
jgi:hypothetical protein